MTRFAVALALTAALAAQTPSELAERRQKLAAKLGPHALLLLFSGAPRVFSNDIDYAYKAESNFFYLTGIDEPGLALLLTPGATPEAREILFRPEKTRRAEVFTGSVISADSASRISGVSHVLPLAQLRPLLAFIAPSTAPAGLGETPKALTDSWKKLYAPLLDAVKSESLRISLFLPAQPDSVEYREEQSLASYFAATSAGFTVFNAAPALRELRQIKSPTELARIRKAIDISAEGFNRAMAVTAPGENEGDIQAQFDLTYAQRGARFGYPTIAGSGPNGTTLHYNENGAQLRAGQTVVIDAGAEYRHYSADITRTLPVDGRFTPEAAELYRIVYRAQQAGIAAARVGNQFGSGEKPGPETLGGSAFAVIKEGLLRLHLITSTEGDQFRVWLPHGIGHQLGLTVHDISKPGVEFAPGMVITVEPGIYIRPDALDSLPKTPENEKFIAAVRPAFEKYKGIGVRIEDDVLITQSGPQVLSAAVPSKLEDVEAAMARLRSAPLP